MYICQKFPKIWTFLFTKLPFCILFVWFASWTIVFPTRAVLTKRSSRNHERFFRRKMWRESLIWLKTRRTQVNWKRPTDYDAQRRLMSCKLHIMLNMYTTHCSPTRSIPLLHTTKTCKCSSKTCFLKLFRVSLEFQENGKYNFSQEFWEWRKFIQSVCYYITDNKKSRYTHSRHYNFMHALQNCLSYSAHMF